MALPINDNKMNLSKYKSSTIRKCPHCRPETAILDPGARACATCMGFGFVCSCLNCGGDGMYKGSTASFGGGDNLHASTCSPCGGKGMYPSRGPATQEEVLASAAVTV